MLRAYMYHRRNTTGMVPQPSCPPVPTHPSALTQYHGISHGHCAAKAGGQRDGQHSPEGLPTPLLPSLLPVPHSPVTQSEVLSRGQPLSQAWWCYPERRAHGQVSSGTTRRPARRAPEGSFGAGQLAPEPLLSRRGLPLPTPAAWPVPASLPETGGWHGTSATPAP